MTKGLEGGRVEEVAGKRLPKHPLSPLLRYKLDRYNKWLHDKLPEDVYQEVALFLLEKCPIGEGENEPDYSHLPREAMNEIMSAFSAHMRRFMRDYGLTKFRFQREEFLNSVPEGYSEDRDSRMKDESEERLKEKEWYYDSMKFSKEVVLGSGSPEEQKNWNIFEYYVDKGLTAEEIAKITGNKVNEIKVIIKSNVLAIRKVLGLENITEWHVPETHGIRHKEFLAKMGITSRNTRRCEVEIDPAQRVSEIMLKFNVSKDTAIRMKNRASENEGIAWYIPDYQPRRKAA